MGSSCPWGSPQLPHSPVMLSPPPRSVLDFDFEKLCSISLSHINVYACLVCGKYFQGETPTGAAGRPRDVGNTQGLLGGTQRTTRIHVLPWGMRIRTGMLLWVTTGDIQTLL